MAARGRPRKSPARAAARANPKQKTEPRAETYRHPEAESLLRPEVGTQPQTKGFDPLEEVKTQAARPWWMP